MSLVTLKGFGKAFLVGALSVFLFACNGGGPAPQQPSPPGSGSAFVFIGDTPPPGSTILKFEITLSGAVLCQTLTAGECGGTTVSLISGPVEIELNQLQLESAFLNLTAVPEGTYAGVKLTFANPELKIMLADGSILELESPALPVAPAMVTPTFDGGLTVNADTKFGFLVDFNVFESIQTDGGGNITSISPMVSLVELPAVAGEEIEELDDATGAVTNLNKTCPTGSFTLTDSLTGLPIPNITFDADTEFEDEGTFNCGALANGQIIEADIKLLAGEGLTSAKFYAEEIEMVNPPDEDELEGLVFQVNDSSQFVLLVQEEEGGPGIPLGSFVTLSLPAGIGFAIDDEGLPIPSTLTFASPNDLLAGQEVEVDVVEGSLVVPTGSTCATVADGCTATAEKLKLKSGTITAQVGTVNDPNFTLSGLPSLFTNPDDRPLSVDCPVGPPACTITSILVSTSSQTEFEDVANVTGLNAGGFVTVRGLLLKSGFAGPGPGTGTPEVIAEKVRPMSP